VSSATATFNDVLVVHVGRGVLPAAPLPGALWYITINYFFSSTVYLITPSAPHLRAWGLIFLALVHAFSCLLHGSGIRGRHHWAALREEADRLVGAGVPHHLHLSIHDLRQRPYSRYSIHPCFNLLKLTKIKYLIY